jgi:type II restriction/modification system DNA methylase subunit YeeA
MRTEYVVPLLARYQANIDRLNEQVDGASGGEATRLKRDRDNLSKNSTNCAASTIAYATMLI